MKDLYLEFKNATGKMPIQEIELNLEESEFIPDHYLININDVRQITSDNELIVSKYSDEYVEFLEEKINILQQKTSVL